MFKSVLGVAFIYISCPAFAGIMCSSGNLANLIGTACDIGSVEFTFISWQTVPSAFGGEPQPDGLEASDLMLTPLSDGFTLTGPSVTVFGYSDSMPMGQNLDSALVAQMTMLAPSMGISGVQLTSSFTFAGIDTVAIAHWSVNGGQPTLPFQAGLLTARPFILSAGSYSPGANIYDTATWNGSSTLTFNTVPTPEPSSLVPLAAVCIMLGLCCIRTRRDQLDRASSPDGNPRL